MYAPRQLETPRHTPWFRDALPSDEEAASESDQGGFLLGKRVSFGKKLVKNSLFKKRKQPFSFGTEPYENGTLLETSSTKMGLFWKTDVIYYTDMLCIEKIY